MTVRFPVASGYISRERECNMRARFHLSEPAKEILLHVGFFGALIWFTFIL